MNQIYLVSTIIFINHRILCLSGNEGLFTRSFELPTLRLLDWNKNKSWLEKSFSDKVHAPVHLLGLFDIEEKKEGELPAVHEYFLASISEDTSKLLDLKHCSFVDCSNLNESPLSIQDRNVIQQALSMVSYAE